MKRIALILLLFANQAFSQIFKETTLQTSIDEVTVFLQGAQITRTGTISIAPGKSTVIIKALSPHLDDKSIQVKAEGAFTILSVNHKFNYLNEIQKSSKIDSLESLVKTIESNISNHGSRLEILLEKQSLLNANKNLGGENSVVTLIQLKQAIEFYDQELSAIKSEELNIKMEIEDLQGQKSKLTKQVNEINKQTDLPSSEIEIRVDAKAKTTGDFTITFMVANAGWYPKYDVRVEDVESPIALNYKAETYQNTGVDWDNIKLKFSNGNPNQSGVAPELNTWYLNFARNTIFNSQSYGVVSNSFRNISGKVLDETGQPLPGANVLVKNTTIGTISDVEGNYSLTLPNGATHLVVSFIGYATQDLPITSELINIEMIPDMQQLQEVVVTGYALQGRTPGVTVRGTSSQKAETIITSTVENQTTVEFEVELPYTIKSNGEKLSVDLNTYQIEAIYEYYAVPKIDKDAFLIAKIINWDQYNLLEGEANLYFEDAYVGRSILDAKSLSDTLNISLGRDKNIVLGRTKIENFTKRRFIGSNQVENVGFKIIARNKKSQPIKLTVFDQIPVSAISDITVTPKELSDGKLNEKTGEVTWELHIASQQQTESTLQYEVKYPKHEEVVLE